MTEFSHFSISYIEFTDDDIRKVAEHTGVTEQRVRDYLADPTEKDRQLFDAFWAVAGAYPLRQYDSVG